MNEDQDDLTPSEAARGRRRDRAAEAQARAGMNTGLAKQFKQVLDMQVKRAKEADGEGDAPKPAKARRRKG